MRKAQPQKRSKASKIILILLSRIRKLCCDRTGRVTRIQYADKVFRDVCGAKAFIRRVSCCRKMSQVVQVFNEIGVTTLWSLLNDETFYEVLTLLVDVQERKDELKHQLKKAQKKLGGGVNISLSEKGKYNKKIRRYQEELKWLNKRYKDAVESIQDSLNLHTAEDNYKDRFAALKRFGEQGSIVNGYLSDYEDDDEFSMNFAPSRRRTIMDDLDGLDFDDFGEDSDLFRKEDRLSKLEDQMSRLIDIVQAKQTGGLPPATKEEMQNASPMEKRIINILTTMGRQMDAISERMDDLESSESYEDDEDDALHPGSAMPSQYSPSMSDIEDMLAGNPVSYQKSAPQYSPYVPNDPAVDGFPTTKELLEKTRAQDQARQQQAPVIHREAIDCNNRQEVLNKPTDYQVQQQMDQASQSMVDATEAFSVTP